MGKRRQEDHQRSVSKNRKRSRRDKSRSRSYNGESRCCHHREKRGRTPRRHVSSKDLLSPQISPSRHSSHSSYPREQYSDAGSTERFSSDDGDEAGPSDVCRRQRMSTPTHRSERSLPLRGGRPPSPARSVISERSLPLRGGRPPSPACSDISGRPLFSVRGGRPPSPANAIDNNCNRSHPDSGERSPEVIVINNDIILPEDTLQALGEQQNKVKKSITLHHIIKNRWEAILSKGLDKAEKETLLEKHLPPDNLITIKAPVINNEILKAIPPNTQNRDKFQQLNQNQLGRGLSALGAGINTLLSNSELNKENKNSVLTLLSESGKILTDVHYNMSLARRALIVPTLNKTIGDISKTAPVEELLFGSDLSERIKTAKAMEKSIGEIKQRTETAFRTARPRSSSQTGTLARNFRKNLNSWGPSGFRREPRQQRGQHLQQAKQRQRQPQTSQARYK